MSISRRRRVGAVVLAELILLAGCTGQGNPGGSAPAGSSATSAAASASATDSGAGLAGRATSAVAASSTTESPQPGDPGYVQPEGDPVAFDEYADAGEAQVRIDLEPVMGEATLPGEVSGPALQVHVTVEAGGEPLDLTGAAVTLHYGDQDASAGLLSEGTQTLPEEVSAGGTATGDYVFSVPEDARDRVVVRVYVSTDLPVTVFQGAAS